MKPTTRMKYATILALPDSKAKFLVLERKLLKLQPHGTEFEKAVAEWRRMFAIYRKEQK